ncbi:hypothetical protein PGTUg99_023646 [Puccinia graminis f. sp. tritici]|uniref:Uncharacterized protein n=1 Tax=Puccinia graminis f. sp. tritici TaxID=56615 RepID=A0A5B0MVL2_PUCGR|nr:hypothetical protein PGTUg99_023454 [Puccinia graminis f. sp. tritici]KAA1080218.1 hypothetical protein PGTUg99_023646 [Puccinia graminis f. sp. tritici]
MIKKEDRYLSPGEEEDHGNLDERKPQATQKILPSQLRQQTKLPSLRNPIHSSLSNCKPIFCLIEITKSRFTVEAIVPHFKSFRREHLASLKNRELIFLLIDAIVVTGILLDRATADGKETRQKLLPRRELDYLAIETVMVVADWMKT